MQKKALFLVFYLWAVVLAHGTNKCTFSSAALSSGVTILNCSIPAPTNFHVVEMGTNNVKLAWNYQPDAVGGYRIRTYRSSDHQLVNTTNKGQDQLNVVINNLSPGTGYNFEISSCCENGDVSEFHGNTDGYTLILELVVDGYEGPSNTIARCTIDAFEEFCEFGSGETFHFKVQKGGYERKFGILVTPDPNGGIASIDIRLKDYNNSNMPIKFYCDQENNSPNPLCHPLNSVCIYFNSLLLAKIGIISENGALTSRVFCSEYVTGAIYRVDPYGNGFADPGNSNHTNNHPSFSNEESFFASASPNPFTESLGLRISKFDSEKITAQLYNLSGQKVLDQQFPGGQDQYTLSTENLANGFYFLRIEADGNVQTLKVVKSE